MGTSHEIRERFAQDDPNFQRLVKRHREFSAQLEKLQAIRHPNDSERLEEIRLKKMKLALKDHMEEIVRRARN